jgi:hypothetical protein
MAVREAPILRNIYAEHRSLKLEKQGWLIGQHTQSKSG